MSANALALSQENRRFLSCQGQISCKSLPPSKPSRVAPQSLWQRGAAIQMLAPHRNDRRGGFGHTACGPGTGSIEIEKSCSRAELRRRADLTRSTTAGRFHCLPCAHVKFRDEPAYALPAAEASPDRAGGRFGCRCG